jgi:hypothetical protein
VEFALDLPRAATVSWSVFDVQGRAVWRETRNAAAGRTVLSWNGGIDHGGRAPTGVYLTSVEIGSERIVRRFVWLK